MECFGGCCFAPWRRGRALRRTAPQLNAELPPPPKSPERTGTHEGAVVCAKSEAVKQKDILDSERTQTEGVVAATDGTVDESDPFETRNGAQACQGKRIRPVTQQTGIFEEPVPLVMPVGEVQEHECYTESWGCHEEDLRESMDVLQLACAAEEEALREVEDALRWMMQDSQRRCTEAKAQQAKETALDALRQAVQAAKEDSR